MSLIIVSGLMSSKVLFPGLGSANQLWFKVLHHSLPNLVLVIVGIHVGLHGQWIMGMLKKIFKVQSSNWTKVMVKVSLVIVIIFGVMQILNTQVTPLIAQSGNSANLQQQLPENYEGQSEKNGFYSENHGARSDDRKGGQHEGLGKGKMKGESGGTNPTGVILVYSGIIGVVAIITYFGEKILTRRKKKV